MKKILLAIVALLACHTMQAQYFCTTQGTELHYVNYDEAGQSLSNETVTVYNVVKNASGESAQYLAKIVTNKTKNNTSYTLYNWNYDGNVTTCQEDLMYGPYIKSDSDPAKYDSKARQAMAEELKLKGDNSFTIKKHASAGESIPDRTYSLISNMLKNEINISGAAYMGEEKVSTTAGKFDCIKISYLKRTKIVLKTETVRVTEWYAEGIGLVKSESYNTKGEPDGKTILVKIVK
ncbi:hypothetical protein [Phocaeicola coprocola]|jgi:hypothetical protein|uniref:TapB family protein n=1 Tax=Phocaeicola coprocola TaxID=310298 RepID=UPI00266F3A2B|nr:hypothetical protein [Phocaeicola coprocola]